MIQLRLCQLCHFKLPNRNSIFSFQSWRDDFVLASQLLCALLLYIEFKKMKNIKIFQFSSPNCLCADSEFKLWLVRPSNHLSKTEAGREKYKSLSYNFLSRKVAGKITLQDRTQVSRWIISCISGIIQSKFYKFEYLLY